jgi:hypothetical protein
MAGDVDESGPVMSRLSIRALRAFAFPTFVAVALVCASNPVPAFASDCGQLFDGTYSAFSDGVWAKTHESFHDEDSVTATWTVSTDCASYVDCTGTVTSDQGWTATATCRAGSWSVPHDIPNWQNCADGTFAPGRQQFLFSLSDTDPTGYDGQDKTTGPSGSCGINRWLTISMPFTLTKL